MRGDLSNTLLQAGQRIDDVVLMRWLQPDSTGLIAGNNYYEFANNGPTGAVDPSGLESVDEWKKKAAKGLVASPPKTVQDAIDNNKKITAFYASLYKSDPVVYFWFGMAAYASAGVGEGLKELKRAMKLAPGLEVFGNKPSDVFAILAVGNHMIYQDISWVALAYESGGIEELKKCKKSIGPVAFRGWENLDKAIHAKGEEKLKLTLMGTKDIVRREQEVLQSVLDSVEDKKLIRKLNPLLQVRIPPFKGAGWGPGDFGDLKYRLSRIYDVMLPSFLDYQFKSPDEIMKFMEQRIAEGK